jgi:predicted transcriptional regulator of viral defense system
VPLDIRVASVAARQGGVAHFDQLRACGLGTEAIRYRLKVGRLHRLIPRVYAVGHTVVSRKGWLHAALLYCGPSSVLSHWTSAEVRGVSRRSSRLIHVTVPGRNGFKLGDLRVHRTRRLEPADTEAVDGLQVTSLSRTFLDCARLARPGELVSMMEQAQRMRIFDMPAV